MISVITAVWSPSRVENVKNLNKLLKEKSGISFEHIIVVDGNTETYKLLEGIGDKLIFLPENGEWVHAMNEGVKQATFEYIVHIDEDVIELSQDVLKNALYIFKDQFSDGEGVLGFHDGKDNSPRWLTTKKYSFKNNLGNLMWPEYIHSGDREVYLKAVSQNKYHYDASLIVREQKVNDYSRERSLKTIDYDDALLAYRDSKHYPHILTSRTIKDKLPTNETIKYFKH